MTVQLAVFSFSFNRYLLKQEKFQSRGRGILPRTETPARRRPNGEGRRGPAAKGLGKRTGIGRKGCFNRYYLGPWEFLD